MFEIPWTRLNATTDVYIVADFTFKRKNVAGRVLYEAWRGDELITNELDYFGCIRAAYHTTIDPGSAMKYMGC